MYPVLYLNSYWTLYVLTLTYILCTASCECNASPRICPSPLTTAAPVSSQLLSMPNTIWELADEDVLFVCVHVCVCMCVCVKGEGQSPCHYS